MRGVVRVIIVVIATILIGARALAVASDGLGPVSMAPTSSYLVAVEVGADVIVHADRERL